MRRSPVSSSALVSVGYDAATRTLEVEFVSAEVYRYLDVSPEQAAGLLWAESKGTYLNQQIKPHHESVYVGGP